jgi:hypothetical protein
MERGRERERARWIEREGQSESERVCVRERKTERQERAHRLTADIPQVVIVNPEPYTQNIHPKFQTL